VAAPTEPAPPSSRRQTIESIVAIALVMLFVTVTALVTWPEKAPEKMSFKGIGTIVAAGLTLIMYSFLYRDNPLYKAAENLYVGVAMGYGAVIAWQQVLLPEVVEPVFLAGSPDAFWYELKWRIVPIVLGAMLVTRLSRKHGWLSRYPIALMVGWAAGLGISVTIHSFVLTQLDAAVQPIQMAMAQPVAGDLHSVTTLVFKGLGAIFVLVGTVAVLFYFFFSVKHNRAGRSFSKVGIWFLMVSFGASFGYTVMGRISLLIGRVQFLIEEWLGHTL